MGRGGSDSRAAQRRSSVPRKRKWTDERILGELERFVVGFEFFPTRRQFEAAGRGDLRNAIKRGGGPAVWAPRVGRTLREAQRRTSLDKEEAVRQAREVLLEQGYLPGSTRLRELGYPKLATFIYFAGGAKRFCLRYGVHLRNE